MALLEVRKQCARAQADKANEIAVRVALETACAEKEAKIKALEDAAREGGRVVVEEPGPVAVAGSLKAAVAAALGPTPIPLVSGVPWDAAAPKRPNTEPPRASPPPPPPPKKGTAARIAAKMRRSPGKRRPPPPPAAETRAGGSSASPVVRGGPASTSTPPRRAPGEDARAAPRRRRPRRRVLPLRRLSFGRRRRGGVSRSSTRARGGLAASSVSSVSFARGGQTRA